MLAVLIHYLRNRSTSDMGIVRYIYVI